MNDLAAVGLDLVKVRDGTASFEERARLEHFLLVFLMEQGQEPFDAMVLGLAEPSFEVESQAGPSEVRRYVAPGPSPDSVLAIDAHWGGDVNSINVVVAPLAAAEAAEDPRHRTFYRVWENIPAGVTPPEVARFGVGRRAVFLIGLLEAELMNGGFGQYLTNTDGYYVEDTVGCLTEIGSSSALTLLLRALDLREGMEPFFALWERESGTLSDLDAQFLDAGEDLAGLTVDRFREQLDPGSDREEQTDVR